MAFVREAKFWPTVGRVDSAYGDRNLMCSCLPLSEYEEEAVEDVVLSSTNSIKVEVSDSEEEKKTPVECK